METKNIVIINGSPKKESDSEKLALKLVESLKASGLNCNIQFFKLVQMDVKNCTGCLECKESGLCSQIDDIIKIKDGLKKADFVVFSSPVHISHISSILHNFFERLIIDLHTFEYFRKPFINIISTNGSGEKEADKFLSKIGLLFGMVKIGFTFISKNDVFRNKDFNKLTKKIHNILSGKYIVKPTIANNIYFYFMKMTIKNNPDFFVYENKIWQERGWFNK
jgi:multimeric flavodoxin WrbA